jgi:hypothetical protein
VNKLHGEQACPHQEQINPIVHQICTHGETEKKI